MKDFIKKHKKGCIIGIIIFLLILTIFFTIFFILPSFGGNNYGNRLENIEKHKISTKQIKEIKNEISEEEGVTKITYHSEGRILNFIITVEDNTNMEQAKSYGNKIINKISKKNQKYYDIQIFIGTKEESKIYPIAGYKHKTSDEISWGNVGETSE